MRGGALAASIAFHASIFGAAIWLLAPIPNTPTRVDIEPITVTATPTPTPPLPRPSTPMPPDSR